MDISIIIPVHNLEKHIEKCLDSIKMQNYARHNMEILVVLDSCTDKSMHLVKEWTKQNSELTLRIFEVNCKNPGGTRNVGLDNAKGEYVYFLDGDDWFVDQNALSKMIKGIMQSNVLKIIKYSSTKEFPEMDTVWRYLFRRSFIADTKFKDIRMSEDYAFMFTLRQKEGWSDTAIEGPLMHYNNPREGSIMTEYYAVEWPIITQAREQFAAQMAEHSYTLQ